MPTCFVIQPFDAGKYDKRYEDVFAPAICDAGLEPYRVDRDHKVEVPIDAIEAGIRDAAVVFADITTDNPNVWYELGFAFATGRPVVMACAAERTKYPFDIQHRTVVRYTTESTSDFQNLRENLKQRLEAVLAKGETIRQLADSEQVAPVAGLSQPELTVLSVLAGSVFPADGHSVNMWQLQKDVGRAGLTAVGFSVGLRRLQTKRFVDNTKAQSEDGWYDAVAMTAAGWDWIEKNEDKFILRRERSARATTTLEFDDDIPF